MGTMAAPATRTPTAAICAAWSSIPAADWVREGVAMSIGSNTRHSSVVAEMATKSTAQRLRARASPTART